MAVELKVILNENVMIALCAWHAGDDKISAKRWRSSWRKNFPARARRRQSSMVRG